MIRHAAASKNLEDGHCCFIIKSMSFMLFKDLKIMNVDQTAKIYSFHAQYTSRLTTIHVAKQYTFN